MARGDIRAGRAFVELGVLDKTAAGLRKAQRRLAAFGASMRAHGQSMLRAAGVAAAPLALATVAFAGFQHRMARVRALTGATGDDFDRLRSTAARLGETTVYSARQAADAMGFFALAGFDVSKIISAMGPTLSLAAAGQLGVAQAADITAKIMAGMGIETAQLGHTVDVLTKAMTTANTDLIQLGDAMKFIGPVARAAGISLEETVAAIQMMSNAGIQGQMAGTSLRMALLSLTAPSAEASQLLSQLGIRVRDVHGNVRPLVAIVDDLEQSLSGLGSAAKLGILGTIFSARAASGMAALVGQGATRLREFTDALLGAGGTAERVAKEQLDTLTGDAILLKSALEGVGVAVGTALNDRLRAAVQWITRVAGAVKEWAKRWEGLVRGIGTGIVLVGALGASLTAMGIAAQVTAFAILGLAKAIKGVAVAVAYLRANPLVAVLTALGVVAVAGGAALWKVCRGVTKLRTESRLLMEDGKKLREGQKAQIATLQKLAAKHSLNRAEIKQARDILADLTKRYGDFGVRIDKTTGQLNVASGAWDKLAGAMERVAKVKLDRAIREAYDNLRRLNKQLHERGESWTTLFGRGGVRNIADAIARETKWLGELLEERRSLGRGGEAGDFGSFGAPGDVAAAGVASDWERRVAQLRLEKEHRQDEEAKALALLNERYNREIEQAKDIGTGESQLADMRVARDLEREQLVASFAERRALAEIQSEADLARIRADMIEDTYDRELALIDINHGAAVDAARIEGDLDRELAADRLRAARLDLAAVYEGDRVAGANLQRTRDIEELILRTKHEGIDLEEELLWLERERARLAARPGESLDLIEREYDLRERVLGMQAGMRDAGRYGAAGTFSPAAVWGISGISVWDRIAKATEETAANTRQGGGRFSP